MSAAGNMGQATAPSRREFLKVSLAAGGGMLLAFQPGGAWAQGAAPAKYVLRPEAFIRSDLGVLLSQLCDVFTGRTHDGEVLRLSEVLADFPVAWLVDDDSCGLSATP